MVVNITCKVKYNITLKYNWLKCSKEFHTKNTNAHQDHSMTL